MRQLREEKDGSQKRLCGGGQGDSNPKAARISWPSKGTRQTGMTRKEYEKNRPVGVQKKWQSSARLRCLKAGRVSDACAGGA